LELEAAMHNKLVRAALCALVCVIVESTAAYGQTPCIAGSTGVVPFPFQVTTATPAQPARNATQPTKEAKYTLLRVPRFYFAIIDSIAIKGSQPTDAYLALELRTWAPIVSVTQSAWGRHFLYAREPRAANDGAVYIRERLNIRALPTSDVVLGIQSSAAAAVEPFAVTITGTFVDCRDWASK
jgi:hypothetical protein